MVLDSLYEKVMNLDQSIRYAVILNSTGEKISGGYRQGLNPMLDEDQLKMVHFYAGQRWDTRKNLTHKTGKTKYAMAEYEKIKRMTFPIDEKHLLMVTTEVDTDHQKIITQVLDLIKDYS